MRGARQVTSTLVLPQIEYRDYQLAAIEELRRACQRSGSALYRLPTGAGKTIVFAGIAQRAAARGKVTLLLVHRRELVRQAVDTLTEAVPGIPIGVEAAGWPSMPWARLQVASIQTLARRGALRFTPDLVGVDEAHHCRAPTWAKVLDRWPGVWRIGLTATPERLDGRGLGEHFAEMVHGPEIAELVAAGHLAPCRTLTIPSSLITDGVPKNRRGDYRAKDLAERVTPHVVAEAADAYLRYARGRRAIFFGIDRAHSRRVCAALNSRGVRAAHVDGSDPVPLRDRIMKDFATGGIDVLCNCQIVTEGFDAPSCDAVILGAHTTSVPMFLQMAGRAMRPGDNKTALIVDTAGICHSLGLPDQTREWSLADGEVNTRDRKSDVDRVRVCDRCRTAYKSAACPHCGAIPTALPVEEVKTDLVDAKPVKLPSRNRSALARLHEIAPLCVDEDDFMARARAVRDEHGFSRGWERHARRLVWHSRKR